MDRYWTALLAAAGAWIGALLAGEARSLATGQPTFTNHSRRRLRLAVDAIADAVDPDTPTPRPRYGCCALLVAVCIWLPLHLITGRFSLWFLIPRTWRT